MVHKMIYKWRASFDIVNIIVIAFMFFVPCAIIAWVGIIIHSFICGEYDVGLLCLFSPLIIIGGIIGSGEEWKI